MGPVPLAVPGTPAAETSAGISSRKPGTKPGRFPNDYSTGWERKEFLQLQWPVGWADGRTARPVR